MRGKKAAEMIQYFNILQCFYRTLNSAHTQDGRGSWGEIGEEGKCLWFLGLIATVD